MINKNNIYKDEQSNKIVYYHQKYHNYINKICRGYKINHDDIETCKLYGLWRFVKTFDPEKSQEKTYIVKCIKWELNRFVSKKILEYDSNLENIKDNSNDSNNSMVFILDSLSDDFKTLIELRYIHKYSILELTKYFNVCKQTIHNRLGRAKLILKQDMGV